MALMQIYGAVIVEQGITFAIVSVRQSSTLYTTRLVQTRQELSQFFPNMPIILMSQDNNGISHYYGRKDIVAFLKTIRVDQIPWKIYHIY